MTSCFVLVAECARLSREHKLCCKNHYDAIFTQFEGKMGSQQRAHYDLVNVWKL